MPWRKDQAPRARGELGSLSGCGYRPAHALDLPAMSPWIPKVRGARWPFGPALDCGVAPAWGCTCARDDARQRMKPRLGEPEGHKTASWVRRGVSFWVSLAVMLTMLLVLAAVAIVLQRSASEAARASALSDLAAVAALKTAQVSAWRRERLAEARLLTMPRSPLFEVEAKPGLATPAEAGAAERLMRRLEQIRAILGYEAVLIADRSGTLKFGAGRVPQALDAVTAALVRRAATSEEALFGVLARGGAAGEGSLDASVWIDVAAAYRDASGEVLAVLLLRRAADAELFPLLQRWPTGSASAESLLVARELDDIVFLNPLRHAADAPLSRRRPLASESVVGAKAVRGETGIVEGVDYRGVEVVADLRRVPDSDWFMVAKVDLTELQTEGRQRGAAVLLLAGGAVVTVVLTFMVVLAVQRRNAWRARFRGERAERLALEEYRATLQGLGDGVLTCDAEGRVRHMNPIAEELTGWTETEARGRPVQDVFRIVEEGTRAAVESPVTRVMREGKVLGLGNHTLLIDRRGTERPIADSAAPVRRDDGRLAGVVLVFRDQSAERAALRALQASESRLRRLFEGSADALLLLDMDERRFIDCNDATVMMLGLKDRAEVLGSHPAELSPPKQEDGRGSAEKAVEMIETARRAGYHRFEWAHCSRARAPFPVDVLLTPITEGPPALAVVTWRDLSEVKRIERDRAAAAAELAERNDELARFNRAAVDRELRMVELKREADALRERLGEPPRHRPREPGGEGEDR